MKIKKSNFIASVILTIILFVLVVYKGYSQQNTGSIWGVSPFTGTTVLPSVPIQNQLVVNVVGLYGQSQVAISIPTTVNRNVQSRQAVDIFGDINNPNKYISKDIQKLSKSLSITNRIIRMDNPEYSKLKYKSDIYKK